MFALRFIAQRSGVAAPMRDQYAEERAQLLATARMRKEGDLLAPLLPTVGQIERLFDGDWDAALVYTDLERVKPKPVPPPKTPGLSRAEATAHWPSQPALCEFCRRAGARMESQSRGDPIATVRPVATALLAAEGISAPPSTRAASRCEVAPAQGAGRRDPRSPAAQAEARWSEGACVEAVARWLRDLPASAKTSKAAYFAFQRGKPEYPGSLGLRRAWWLRRDQAQGSR